MHFTEGNKNKIYKTSRSAGYVCTHSTREGEHLAESDVRHAPAVEVVCSYVEAVFHQDGATIECISSRAKTMKFSGCKTECQLP